MKLSLRKPSIENVNIKAFELKESKPIQRFTSRPFVPTPSNNKVARLRPVISEQLKSVLNDSRKVQPARRLISHVLTSRPLRSRPLTSAPQTTPYLTTTLPTTPPSTTPGVCRSFCNLVGKIAVKSGLLWTEELLHSFTTYYKEVTAEIVVNISEVFQNFYGTAFEFASVESYNKVKSMIYVQFYVQFNGHSISDVTTANLRETFEDSIRNGDEFQIGRFLIDMNQTEFHVVDTSQDSLIGGYTAFPDWAWIALIGGLLSSIIIAIVASVACVQGYRRNQVLKRSVLSRRVLEALHEKHFAREGVAGRYKDRRDMWALQRDNQANRDGKSGNQGRTTHDISTAGLITGLDNTWQDNSSQLYDSKMDHNTSLDNSNLSERNKLKSWSEDEAFADESVFRRNSKLRMSREEI